MRIAALPPVARPGLGARLPGLTRPGLGAVFALLLLGAAVLLDRHHEQALRERAFLVNADELRTRIAEYWQASARAGLPPRPAAG